MQQQRGQFPRGRCLFWTLCTSEVGLAYPCNVHEQLLTFLVLRTREEGTDKRFDRVTRVGILQRSSGPARHELLLKLLFPPFGCAKERHEFVRNVLETSSAECAQYFEKSFVFIHRLLTSRECSCPVARARAYHITFSACDTAAAESNVRSPTVSSRMYTMSKNGRFSSTVCMDEDMRFRPHD